MAAVQEERFSRKKHDPRSSENVIKYCLEEAGVFARELDYVVFCDKPFLSFKRLLMSYFKPINKKTKESNVRPLKNAQFRFKFKEGKNFNHPDEIGTGIHILNISRINPLGGLKFGPDTEIGRKGVFCKGLNIKKTGRPYMDVFTR